MSVEAVDDLHQATGRDLNLVVGDKYNATVGGDMQERIEGVRQSIAGISHTLKSTKVWVGSDSLNILKSLSDLAEIVAQMNQQISIHTHASSPPPNNDNLFSDYAAQSTLLTVKVLEIC